MEEELDSSSSLIGKVVLKIALMVTTVVVWAAAQVAYEKLIGAVGVVEIIVISIPFLWGLKRIAKSEGGVQAFYILSMLGLTAILVIAIISAVFWR